jgi:four helix bundle protein
MTSEVPKAEFASVAKPEGYEDLLVWQKGMKLVKKVYEITRPFPSDEKFGLVSQMRRAAVSIPSNIAEGQERHSTGEFIQSLSHAQGSLAELNTQLLLSIDLGFSSKERTREASELAQELRRMLNALRRKLEGLRVVRSA